MFPENIEKGSEKNPTLIPLEHIIKFEPEAFADSVVLGKTEEATIDCKLDVGPKALDCSMKPVVVLKCLDEATVSFWTKWKTAASNLTKHTKDQSKNQVRRDRIETCNVCGIKKKRNLLLKHMKVHESKQECPRCHKLYANLICHLRHCQKEIGCVQCGEVLKGKKALRFHKLTVHSKGPVYYCHCGEVFENQNNLYGHRKWVHSTERLPCTHCDKSYGDRNTLLQHWRKKHLKKFGPFNRASEQYKRFDPALNHKGPYFCDFCGKKFPTRRTVYQHMKLLHVIKPFILCDLCPMSFRQKFEIERHIIWNHLKIKSLVCRVCGFKTSNKGTFKRHKMTHQKKTKCPKCDRLVACMRQHRLGCNKFRSCPICKKTVTRNGFAQHKKMHIKEQIAKFHEEVA